MRGEKTDEGITVPKIRLRSQPTEDFPEEAAEIMIKDMGFFDSEWHTAGTGFPNQYELRENGMVVYDHASGLMWQQSGSDNMPYDEIKYYLETLKLQHFAGYCDWRLPTLEEAMSLLEPVQNTKGRYIDLIFDQMQQWIWTSDMKPGFWKGSPWVVYFDAGECNGIAIVRGGAFVRAVR